jgi:hypothetical protein
MTKNYPSSAKINSSTKTSQHVPPERAFNDPFPTGQYQNDDQPRKLYHNGFLTHLPIPRNLSKTQRDILKDNFPETNIYIDGDVVLDQDRISNTSPSSNPHELLAIFRKHCEYAAMLDFASLTGARIDYGSKPKLIDTRILTSAANPRICKLTTGPVDSASPSCTAADNRRNAKIKNNTPTNLTYCREKLTKEQPYCSCMPVLATIGNIQRIPGDGYCGYSAASVVLRNRLTGFWHGMPDFHELELMSILAAFSPPHARWLETMEAVSNQLDLDIAASTAQTQPDPNLPARPVFATRTPGGTQIVFFKDNGEIKVTPNTLLTYSRALRLLCPLPEPLWFDIDMIPKLVELYGIDITYVCVSDTQPNIYFPFTCKGKTRSTTVLVASPGHYDVGLDFKLTDSPTDKATVSMHTDTIYYCREAIQQHSQRYMTYSISHTFPQYDCEYSVPEMGIEKIVIKDGQVTMQNAGAPSTPSYCHEAGFHPTGLDHKHYIDGNHVYFYETIRKFKIAPDHYYRAERIIHYDMTDPADAIIIKGLPKQYIVHTNMLDELFAENGTIRKCDNLIKLTGIQIAITPNYQFAEYFNSDETIIGDWNRVRSIFPKITHNLKAENVIAVYSRLMKDDKFAIKHMADFKIAIILAAVFVIDFHNFLANNQIVQQALALNSGKKHSRVDGLFSLYKYYKAVNDAHYDSEVRPRFEESVVHYFFRSTYVTIKHHLPKIALATTGVTTLLLCGFSTLTTAVTGGLVGLTLTAIIALVKFFSYSAPVFRHSVAPIVYADTCVTNKIITDKITGGFDTAESDIKQHYMLWDDDTNEFQQNDFCSPVIRITKESKKFPLSQLKDMTAEQITEIFHNDNSKPDELLVLQKGPYLGLPPPLIFGKSPMNMLLALMRMFKVAVPGDPELIAEFREWQKTYTAYWLPKIIESPCRKTYNDWWSKQKSRTKAALLSYFATDYAPANYADKVMKDFVKTELQPMWDCPRPRLIMAPGEVFKFVKRFIWFKTKCRVEVDYSFAVGLSWKQFSTLLTFLRHELVSTNSDNIVVVDGDCSEYDASESWPIREEVTNLDWKLAEHLGIEWVNALKELNLAMGPKSVHIIEWPDGSISIVEMIGRQVTGDTTTADNNTETGRQATDFLGHKVKLKPYRIMVHRDDAGDLHYQVIEKGDYCSINTGDDFFYMLTQLNAEKLRDGINFVFNTGVKNTQNGIGLKFKGALTISSIDCITFCSRHHLYNYDTARYVVIRKLDRFLCNTPFTTAVRPILNKPHDKLLMELKALAYSEGQCIQAWAGDDMPIFSSYARSLMRNGLRNDKIISKKSKKYDLELQVTDFHDPTDRGVIMQFFLNHHSISPATVYLVESWLSTCGLFDQLNCQELLNVIPVKVEPDSTQKFDETRQGYLLKDGKYPVFVQKPIAFDT